MALPYKPGGVTVTIGRSQEVSLPSRVFRGRATCMHFDTDKSFLLPPSVTGVRNIVSFFQRHPGTTMLVNGHTDLVGDAAYNLQLSNERAAAVAAYLLNKADDWLAWYSSSIPSKRWSRLEDQHMLQTIKDVQGAPYYSDLATAADSPAAQDATRRFQADNGLAASGQADGDTRRALIAKYMALEGTSLPAGTSLAQHGCGKFHPIDATSQADQGNRRVEIFLFDGPIDPPPQGTCPAPGCQQYPQWVANPDEDIDLCQGRTFDVAVLVQDEASPPHVIGGARVAIDAPGISAIIVDDEGRGTLANVPEGTWQLTASHDGFTTRTQAVTVPGSAPAATNQQAFASKAKSTSAAPGNSTTNAVVALGSSTPLLLVQAQPQFALRSAPTSRRMFGREVGAGHQLTLRDSNSPPTFNVVQTCSADGKATFDISTAADGSYVLELRPASGQDLGGPPTPGTPSGSSPPDQMFNVLSVDVQLTGQQVTSASIPASSLHGNVVEQKPLKLLIDWKPEWIATTFHSARKGGAAPTVLVLHRTDAPANGPQVIGGFINDPHKSSVHYVVDVDGLVVKMVQDSEVANHAGRSFFGGQSGVNDFSIGVEICNVINTEFPAAQQAGVIALVQRILSGASICRHRVVGHGDVGMEASDDMGFVRRLDPGKEFFWPALEGRSLAMKAPATPSAGPSLSSSNYNEFFTQSPGSGQLQVGDSDNKLIWGGKSLKNTSNGTLLAQSQPIAQLQEDLTKIGYFVNGQTGEYTAALAHSVMHFQHRVFTGSNFVPAGVTGPLPDRRTGRPHLETGTFDADTAAMLLGMLDDLATNPCP
jgi:N-acetyl-anhydromuramyl-L-alanine amidase AmpD/outer membrane protein OmpA-like peptidoglycan-associated protein